MHVEMSTDKGEIDLLPELCIYVHAIAFETIS